MQLMAAAAVAILAVAQVPRTSVPMAELTVPPARLPPTCHLKPEPTPALRTPGGRVQIPSSPTQLAAIRPNPWFGTTPATIAAIRERMEGPARVADAVPISPGGAARFQLRWAEGIEEGYAAAYESGAGEVVVHAVRFGVSGSRPPTPRGSTTKVELGDVVAFVYGDGECAAAVGGYLSSLR